MAGFTRFGGTSRRHTASTGEPRLPKGAEAALWSILEAVADVSVAVDVPDVDVRDVDVRDADVQDVDLSPAMDPYYDLGVIEENAGLTSDLFMADSP